MKVDPGTIMIPKAYSNPNAGRSSKTAGGTALKTTTGMTDSVTLSDTTKKLQKISSAMEAPQTDRQEKLSAIKSAIENGTYDVDADKIAEKMLNAFIPET